MKKSGVEASGHALKKDGKAKIHLFIENVSPTNRKRINGIAGKRIFISPLYALAHFNENMWLIQAISNAGGYVNSSPKHSDIFVNYAATTKAGESVFCKQLETVKQMNEKGAGKKIVDLYDFLDTLGVKESDLQKPFDIDLDSLAAAKSRNVYSDSNPATIGDLFKNATQKSHQNGYKPRNNNYGNKKP